jgi:hypothetical protein
MIARGGNKKLVTVPESINYFIGHLTLKEIHAMSKSQRDKGARTERGIVDRHKAIGVHAERYPLSGGSRFRGSGHDIDLYPFGRDAAPFVAEVKARKNGWGVNRAALGNARG